MKPQDYKNPLSAWWATLDGQRGIRARLRHARTPDEVFILPEFHRGAINHMRQQGYDIPPEHLESLAFVVGLLAHAENLEADPFPVLLANREADKSGKDAPANRFIRLMEVRDNETELRFSMLRRLIGFVEKANIQSLIDAAFNWNDATRRRWAQVYYNAAFRKGE